MESYRKITRIAGFAYLIIAIAGIFAEFVVRQGIVVPGDAAATAGNILASESLFRFGFAGDLIMLIFDAVVAIALYVLLVRVNKVLALLATTFRLAHTAMLGINLLNHFVALLFMSGATYLSVFEADQLEALALFFLDAHSYGYLIAQVFFGLHCALLGYLLYNSGFIPKTLGVLMAFASLGYLTESFVLFLFPDYEAITSPGIGAAVIAELSLTFWLILKGVRIHEPNSHAPVSLRREGRSLT